METLKQIFMTAGLALLLATTSAFGDKCMRVDGTWHETDFIFYDPDFLLIGNLKGQLKGELWFYSSLDYVELDPHVIGVPISLSHNEQVLYTKDGEIYMKSYGLYDESTVATELTVVTGGTGKYEGATGQMVALPDVRKPSDDYYSVPVNYIGRICTPETEE